MFSTLTNYDRMIAENHCLLTVLNRLFRYDMIAHQEEHELSTTSKKIASMYVVSKFKSDFCFNETV